MKSLASGQTEAVSLTDAAESRSLPIPPGDCRSFAASQFTRHEDLDPMPMETQIRGCGLDFESRGTRIKLPSTQQQPTETQRFFLLFFGFLISGGRRKELSTSGSTLYFSGGALQY